MPTDAPTVAPIERNLDFIRVPIDFYMCASCCAYRFYTRAYYVPLDSIRAPIDWVVCAYRWLGGWRSWKNKGKSSVETIGTCAPIDFIGAPIDLVVRLQMGGWGRGIYRHTGEQL